MVGMLRAYRASVLLAGMTGSGPTTLTYTLARAYFAVFGIPSAGHLALKKILAYE